MIVTTLTLLLLSCPCTYALDVDVSTWKRVWRRSSTPNVPAEGYYNPTANGGGMLTQIPITFPMGQGEPLNAIITGNSDARVLKDTETGGGLRNYFLSFGFSGECLGQHSGSDQAANLGDGNGARNETAVIRLNYGDPQLGSCKETIQGGNHFRYWVQNGAQANSGAIFMACSYEMPLAQSHDIIVNGYNLGRDWLVGNITGNSVQTLSLTNTTSFVGKTSFANYTYQSDIKYVSGLLANSSFGINHNLSVGTAGENAADGLTAVINVTIIGTPSKSKSAGWRSTPPGSWQLPSLTVIVMLFLNIVPALLLS